MNKDRDNPQITQMGADSRDEQTHAIIGPGMEVSNLRKSAQSAD